MHARLGLFAICATVPISTAAFAGVTLKMEGDRSQTIYLQGNKMRIEMGGKAGVESVVIFDGDSQQLITINPSDKTYSLMTRENLSEMGKRRDEAMAKMSPEQRKQMDEALAKMPPEQRKQMEQMMSGGSGAPKSKEDKKKSEDNIKWEQTGQKQTVAGFRCEGFKELKDGKVDAQGCYIPWSAGAMNKEDLAPFIKLQEFFAQSGIGGRELSDQTFTRIAKMPGFPGTWTHVSESGQAERKEALSSVQRGNVSADKFTPPAGYTKTEQPGMKH